MGRHLGPGRIEVVDDPLAIDAHRHRLAHPHVVEGRVAGGHAHVEDVGIRVLQQLEGVVALDGLVVTGRQVGDVVGVTRLQLEDA